MTKPIALENATKVRSNMRSYQQHILEDKHKSAMKEYEKAMENGGVAAIGNQPAVKNQVSYLTFLAECICFCITEDKGFFGDVTGEGHLVDLMKFTALFSSGLSNLIRERKHAYVHSDYIWSAIALMSDSIRRSFAKLVRGSPVTLEIDEVTVQGRQVLGIIVSTLDDAKSGFNTKTIAWDLVDLKSVSDARTIAARVLSALDQIKSFMEVSR